jgi:hypothetical protein
VESVSGELPILALVETVEACGAVGDVLLDFLGLDQQTRRQYLLAEVALVEFAFEHDFVQVLKLRESELLRQEFESDRLVAELPAQSLERDVQDLRVVEGQPWDVVHREPRGLARVSGRLHAVVGQVHQRIVGDRDHPLTRVAVQPTEGVELFQEDLLEAGLLFQLAAGRFVDGFVDVNEAAREGPLAFKWR